MSSQPAQPAQLIAGIDVMRLLAKQYPDIQLKDRLLDDRGNLYLLSLPKNVNAELLVSLRGSVREAVADFNKKTLIVTLGPVAAPPPVGDERKMWRLPDPTAGSIMVRRANAVFTVSEMADEKARIDLAKFLDEALRVGGEHVKLANGVTPPKITKVDLPKKISVNQTHTAAIEVADIDPLDALITVVGPSFVVEKKPNPVLNFVARPTPGEQRFEMVISTPGNLLSIKEIVVQVN